MNVNIGDKFETNSCGTIEVVDYKSTSNILVKFIATGNEYKTTKRHLLGGRLADSKYRSEIKNYRPGLVFQTGNYGKFVITSIIDKHSVSVLFMDTGTEVTVSISDAISKNVVDPGAIQTTSIDERFCVYLHKTTDGVVRYVGEGTAYRAYSKTRPDQPRWEETFRGKEFTVEIVQDNLSKIDAEILEKELRAIHSATIINDKFATKTPHKIAKKFVERFLYYDPSSPTALRWVNHMKNNAAANSPAGHAKVGGYVAVELCGVAFAAHRIVYTLVHGDFDRYLIVDHIDGNKHNNDISNLRLVSPRQNSLNKKPGLASNTGHSHIRKTDTGYMVRWSDIDGRKNKSFCTSAFESDAICLKAAYIFREHLITCGFIPERVKELEVTLID